MLPWNPCTLERGRKISRNEALRLELESWLGVTEPEISPVDLFHLRFGHWSKTNAELPARVCPGTQLTYATFREGEHTRSELAIPGTRLADYQLRDPRERWGATASGPYGPHF